KISPIGSRYWTAPAGRGAPGKRSYVLDLAARQVITTRQAMALHLLVERTARELQHFHHRSDIALALQQGVVQALRLERLHLLRQGLSGEAFRRWWARQPQGMALGSVDQFTDVARPIM